MDSFKLRQAVYLSAKQAVQAAENTDQALDILARYSKGEYGLSEIAALTIMQEKFGLTNEQTFAAYESWRKRP